MGTEWSERLRAGWRAQRKLLVGLVCGLALGAFGVWLFGSGSHAGSSVDQPTAQSDVGVEQETGHWTCAMHPQIQRSEPGECPLCGMKLIHVESSASRSARDTARVVLSERAKVLAQLRTVVVGRHEGTSSSVRLLGRVVPDETTLRTVTAWTGGRVDRLHVNVTGERVRPGQVIATLYSPEAFAAHQDLLVAKQQVTRLASSPASSRAAAAAALEAARERLRLLGVPDEELSRMEAADKPTQAVRIRSPFGGTVIERVATEGMYLQTGAPLYRIANLGTLWVQMDAYESDLAKLSVGQNVAVHVEALPGATFEGKITFIDPTLDATRRVAQVRVEVKNRDRRLRPGMFAEATVAGGTGVSERSPLVVPSTAPLFTGRRAIVYVQVADAERTAYAPRTVRLGPRLGAFYPVVAGLSEGEVVVERGAFAIDADLQIRGGPSMMSSPDDRRSGGWDAAIELTARQRKPLAPVVSAYLKVQHALAADDLAGAGHAVGTLEKAVKGVRLKSPAEAIGAWPALATRLSGDAVRLARAKDLEGARLAFEGLSQALAELLRRFGNPLSEPLQRAFCPMAMGSEGAAWFQQGTQIQNAYLGESMVSCGEIEQAVGVGGYLGSAGGGHAH